MSLNISIASSSGPQWRWSAQTAGFAKTEGQTKTDLGLMAGQTVYLDFHAVKTGWSKVAAGVAPVHVWNPDLTTRTNNPAQNEVGPDGKPAFKQSIALPVQLPDGSVAEANTNAAGFLSVLISAYDAASAAGAIGPDVCAAFKIGGVVMKKFGPAAVACPDLQFVSAIQLPDALRANRDSFAANHTHQPYSPAAPVAMPAQTLRPAGSPPVVSPVAVMPAPAAPAPAAVAAVPVPPAAV